MTHHANVLLGIIVTLWLAIGILVGAWLVTRDEVIDLRSRLGSRLGAPGDTLMPPAPTETREGSSDESTIRNH